MKVRWFDPIAEIGVEFSVETVNELIEVGIDTLITFRNQTRQYLMQRDAYPRAKLEVLLPTNKWHCPLVPEPVDTPSVPCRGILGSKNSPSDIEIIRKNATAWFGVFNKYIVSTQYYLKKHPELTGG